MTVSTTKFVRKPFYVDAVKVTRDNMEEVATWANASVKKDPDGVEHIYVRVQRPINDKQTRAYVGDWILYSGNGYKVYTQKAFTNSFVHVDGEAKDIFTQSQKLSPVNLADDEYAKAKAEAVQSVQGGE